jgi:hypothetical protein
MNHSCQLESCRPAVAVRHAPAAACTLCQWGPPQMNYHFGELSAMRRNVRSRPNSKFGRFPFAASDSRRSIHACRHLHARGGAGRRPLRLDDLRPGVPAATDATTGPLCRHSRPPQPLCLLLRGARRVLHVCLCVAPHAALLCRRDARPSCYMLASPTTHPAAFGVVAQATAQSVAAPPRFALSWPAPWCGRRRSRLVS